MTTDQNNIPADTHEHIDCKILTNTSFFTLMHELEEHVNYGWRIDPHNAPVANVMGSYEIVLRKDRASIKRAKERIDSVIEAREAANKERGQGQMAHMHAVREQKTRKRKVEDAATANDMMASIKKVQEGGDEGQVC